MTSTTRYGAGRLRRGRRDRDRDRRWPEALRRWRCRAGCRVDRQTGGILGLQGQGQFPAVTISFNLAPGVALGQATDAVQRAQSGLQLPATIIASFQGNAQAFQDSLSTVWILILGALVVVYLILGILYESYIHPITIISTLPSAGVGALATLMLFHFDFSLIALIGIIVLIGIVKKNGIMLVDFAMVAERDDQLSAEDAVRRAALLRFRPIHDDHHGGDARRRASHARDGHRLGTQTTARLRYCGRPPREPSSHAVHNAGHLYLSRSVIGLDIKLAIACG
jgi:AcrB/AcrD/AcrF family